MRERPERRSPVGRAWTLIERIALRMLNAMAPLLILVAFLLILFVGLLALVLLGVAIVGAVYAA